MADPLLPKHAGPTAAVDMLYNPPFSPNPGKYPGIPCEVVRVRRLEKNWYTVLFYTEQDWNNCT